MASLPVEQDWRSKATTARSEENAPKGDVQPRPFMEQGSGRPAQGATFKPRSPSADGNFASGEAGLQVSLSLSVLLSPDVSVPSSNGKKEVGPGGGTPGEAHTSVSKDHGSSSPAGESFKVKQDYRDLSPVSSLFRCSLAAEQPLCIHCAPRPGWRGGQLGCFCHTQTQTGSQNKM